MGKFISALAILAILACSKTHAQSSSATLDVVSWNIEWFGASFEDPVNDDLQRDNAKKIIRYLDADVYGLVEMVDTSHIRKLVDSLGNANYGYVISDFCSNATAPGSGAWRNGQKLVFLYKKSIISNVKTRGMLRTSSNAYTNWASGRFPFLLNADATINGVTKNINFILIHGKAGSTASDYDRRLAGAYELKDTLDAHYPNSMTIIFGDFNDALNITISTGSGPESSYYPIVVDSTDADHYKSITLPLQYAGFSTMINYPNVIDNHVISNELVPFYVQNSVLVRTDIINVVPDFISAHNTSDHWPVFSKYNLSGIVTSVPNITPAEMGISSFPNPFADQLRFRTYKAITNLDLQLINAQGQVVFEQQFKYLPANQTTELSMGSLPAGIYFLNLQTKESRSTIKLMHF